MKGPGSLPERLLPHEALSALRSGLPASSLWSLLLYVLAERASARDPKMILRQFEEDGFTDPSPVDLRSLLELDRMLLAAAPSFEAVELSPLAPLGTCSVMGYASQNKIVSALRGTEVVSDPTNVLALLSAARLRKVSSAIHRLCTSQRVVRAQRLPPIGQRTGITRHFRQHFRIFALATAGLEARDHGFMKLALLEQIQVHLDALGLLTSAGYSFPPHRVHLLARPDRTQILEDVAGKLGNQVEVLRGTLAHSYYSSGLRFQICFGEKGAEVPLIDGGSLDWVARLTSNRRQVFVASAFGSQLAAALYRGR